jgi:hypothetical protein
MTVWILALRNSGRKEADGGANSTCKASAASNFEVDDYRRKQTKKGVILTRPCMPARLLNNQETKLQQEKSI